MQKLLVYSTVESKFWYQRSSSEFSTGQIYSEMMLDTLVKNARSDGALIYDVTLIDEGVMERLYKKFFNGRGLTNEVEEYAEALVLNGAKEIK